MENFRLVGMYEQILRIVKPRALVPHFAADALQEAVPFLFGQARVLSSLPQNFRERAVLRV